MTTLKSGIYEIVNLVNGKRYIGSSVNISARFSTHKYSLRHNTHHSIVLQRAWNKYGERNFVFKPILFCDVNMTLFYEQIFLDKLIPEYNTAKCAESPLRGAIGRKHSLESRKKISLALTGRTFSKEHMDKLIIHLRNMPHPTGRKMSVEQKEHLSKALMGRPAWNKGKKMDYRKIGQQEKVNNKTKFKGVSASRGKYKVTFYFEKKLIYGGTYLTAEEGARAYDKIAKKYYGDCARTNFNA